MPETALERYNARKAQRDELATAFMRRASIEAGAFGKSMLCRSERHGECPGTAAHRNGAECLCPCHDPALTSWVVWVQHDGQLVPGDMCSGHYATVDEAIDYGFASKPADAAWIRAHPRPIEQVTDERWESLMAWDEKTEAERDALRPAAPVDRAEDGAGR